MSAFEDRFRDLSAGWALGALSEEEAREFEGMLGSASAEQLQELREIEEAALHLSVAAESVNPPVEAKEHILATVRAEGAELSERVARQAPQGRGEASRDWVFGLARWLRLDRPRIALGVAATLLTTAVGLAWHATRLDLAVDQERQKVVDLTDSLAERERLLQVLESKQVEIVALDGLEVHPQGYGKIIWDAENHVALLQLSNLPPLPADEVYQLWVYPKEGNPTSGGVFAIDQPDHDAFFRVDRFPAGAKQALRGFLVTREPESGAAEPGESWYLGVRIPS